jgi:tRNA(adenine34) deaminase
MAKKKSANGHRWVKNVKTVSTFPPEHTFDQPAEKIVETMADPKVSPKGLGSAIRMITYFLNRGGKGLSAARKRELEKAKKILQERNQNEKKGKAATRNKAAKKTASNSPSRKTTKKKSPR